MRVHLRHRQDHLAVDVHPEGDRYRVCVDDAVHEVEAHRVEDGALTVVLDGRRYRVALVSKGRERYVAVAGETYVFVSESGVPAVHAVESVAVPEIVAPMPGKVLQVLVQPDDRVAAGDGLLILEAMKMENRLVAEAAGVVVEVAVAPGDLVDSGQRLIVLAYGSPLES